jgi:choline-sulfatase
MTTKPNILFLMVDQLAPHFLPAYGHRVVKTPRLDEIAANSVIFDAHYCNSPLCVPARAGLLTGRLPSAVDVFDSGCDFAWSTPTFAHYLRAGGYVTVMSGKAHHIGGDQLHGFEKRLTTDISPADNCWYAVWDDPDRTLPWFHSLKNVVEAGIAERATQQDHDDDAAHQAVRWLYEYARGNDERPFFLKVSFSNPHEPYVTTSDCWKRYRDDDIDLPVVPFIAPDERDAHGQWLYRHYDRGEFDVTDDHIRTARHAYYGSISMIDDLFGRVLDALKLARLDDNTIIIFCADHGEMLGERGSWYKMSFHEHSARVPLMVHIPGMSGTRRVAQASSLMDLLPTLLEMAIDDGMNELVEPIEGRSLMPLITGDGADWLDETVSEALFEGVRSPGFLIRRGTRKYVHWEGSPCSLFDLADDPNELKNLIREPSCAEEVANFEAEIRQRWPLEKLTERILTKQRRNALVYNALKTGEHTPIDFQPYEDASKRYFRGNSDLHKAMASDQLRFDR